MDAIIKASFWTDHRIEEASAEVKLACLWLVTNPARDLCGFTNVSNKRFEFETSSPISALEGASKGLPSSFKKLEDGTWFSVNFLRHQFGKGGRLKLGNKVVIAAARRAWLLPEGQRRVFFDAYPELLELAGKYHETIAPKEAPSIPLAENRQGVREGEGEREGVEPMNLAVLAKTIVSIYPKKHRQTEAVKELHRQLEAGEDPETIEAGTRSAAAVIQQIPSAHLNDFVPGALTFFLNQRWKDDHQTWLRNGHKSPNGARPPVMIFNGRKPTETIRINS